jgi:hypothetical protein
MARESIIFILSDDKRKKDDLAQRKEARQAIAAYELKERT